MKRWLCLALMAACSSKSNQSPDMAGPAPDMATSDPLSIPTDKGIVHGMQTGTTRAFLGIPYAAPPTGSLRWKPPQPADAWSSPRDATRLGPHCPQLDFFNTGYDAASSEDCLTLNVWTPADTTAPHAVMVWIHGGGFVLGGSDFSTYDGTNLSAAGNVVVVSLNYRLGPLGFLAHSALTAEDPAHPGSGSWGMEDQRAALKWVQNNIAAFGGNPLNVTLFGESAGGISTCLHSLSTPTAGLFHRALIESGPCGLPLPTQAQAETQGTQLATALGCTSGDVLACMRGKSAQQVTTALPLKAGFFLGPGASWGPVVDNVNWTQQPLAAIQTGQLAKVPALLGANKDEGTLFVQLAQLNLMTDTDYQNAITATFGAKNSAAIVAEYPAASYSSRNAAYADVLGDGLFVCPTKGVAAYFAAGGMPTFLYSFQHTFVSAFGNIGAFHSAEIPFVFGNAEYGTSLSADEQLLSQAMQRYWTRFAAAGDPNGTNAVAWPPYLLATDSNLNLYLTITSGTGYKKAKCDFWFSLTP